MVEITIIKAKNYTPCNKRNLDLIVVHDMEAPEKGDTAESVARYFAGVNAPQASAHYCIDNNSIVQCVRDMDIAWHAPGANNNGIGLEHAGYAAQTTDQWLDAYSDAMLNNSADLSANLCKKYSIPAQFVDAKGLLAKQRGITMHRTVNEAFHKSSHTDPGPNFPMQEYIRRINSRFTGATVVDPDFHWDVVSILACPTGGSWMLTFDGGILSVDGAPSKNENIPHGQDYWADRKGAQLRPNPACPVGYTVIATSGETYNYCF